MEIAGHSKADRAGKTPGLNLIAADFQAGIQPGQKQGRPCQGCSRHRQSRILQPGTDLGTGYGPFGTVWGPASFRGDGGGYRPGAELQPLRGGRSQLHTARQLLKKPFNIAMVSPPVKEVPGDQNEIRILTPDPLQEAAPVFPNTAFGLTGRRPLVYLGQDQNHPRYFIILTLISS